MLTKHPQRALPRFFYIKFRYLVEKMNLKERRISGSRDQGGCAVPLSIMLTWPGKPFPADVK